MRKFISVNILTHVKGFNVLNEEFCIFEENWKIDSHLIVFGFLSISVFDIIFCHRLVVGRRNVNGLISYLLLSQEIHHTIKAGTFVEDNFKR